MFIIRRIISDGENNFTKNKYNRLQKISAKNIYIFSEKNKCKSANIGSSTVQLNGVDPIGMQIQN